MSFFKKLATRWLPRPIRQWLKRLYYPSVLRRFDEKDWPGSQVVQKLVKPGDLVIDAGSNIGYVAMLLARWVGNGGRVYCFEPVPETYDLLVHNVRSLGLTQVKCHPMALSAKAGREPMVIPSYEEGGDNLYESHLGARDEKSATSRVVSVDVRRLDDILGPEDRASFIKVDVEGHEEQMIRGAESVIRRSHPALFIEMSDGLDVPGTPSYRLVEFMEHIGYQIYTPTGDAVRLRVKGDSSVDYFFLTPQHVQQLKSL